MAGPGRAFYPRRIARRLLVIAAERASRLQACITIARSHGALGLGLGSLLLFFTACGGGGGDAADLRGDGVVVGQLLPEQSPGQGPAPFFLSSQGGDSADLPWEDRLDLSPRLALEDLLAGDPLHGEVGARGDLRDLIRVSPLAQARRIRVHVEGSEQLRADFLVGSADDPAREIRTVEGSGDLVLSLQTGDELIFLLRATADGARAAWRLSLDEVEDQFLMTASVGGSVQTSEARRALLESLLLCGADRSALGEILVTLRSQAHVAGMANQLQKRGFVLLGVTGLVQRWGLPASTFAGTTEIVDRELTMSRILTKLREELGAGGDFDPNWISPPTSTASYQALGDPDDPLYATWQWNMRLSKMDKAWATSTGLASMPIAVMDTGLLTQHPDLKDRVSAWSYDFISDKDSAGDGDGPDADPQEPPEYDVVTLFHGTYVAGVLGATTNNKVGVAGGTWQGKILGIRVIGKKGMTSWDRIQAWRYLAGLSNSSNTILPVAERPRVLNMSWTVDNLTQAEGDALDALHAAGTIMVAAMGNDGQKDSILRYPAAHDKVIAVGAVDQASKVTAYSNGGSYIDLVAPGGVGSGITSAVISTWARKPTVGSGYEYGYYSFEGTSLATPLVCSAIALMDTQHPGIELPAIRRIIQEGCTDLGTVGWDKEHGHGLLDAEEFVRLAKFYDKPPILSVTPVSRSILDAEGEAILAISNPGGRVLRDFQVQAQGAVSGGLGFAFATPHGPTSLRVTVDRNKVVVGSYRERYVLSSNGGSTPLDFSWRKPIPAPPTAIVVRIQDGSQVVAQTLTDAAGNFRFDSLPAGDFTLVAGVDHGLNGKLGDSQEWYLETPVTIVSGQPLQLGQAQLPWKD